MDRLQAPPSPGSRDPKLSLAFSGGFGRKSAMTSEITPEAQANPYATERHFVDQHNFIEIEFYKDGDAHRVWPYFGHARVEVDYRGHKFISDGKEHFAVPGAFETQDVARDEAISGAVELLSN
jgi:hypothetical protein